MYNLYLLYDIDLHKIVAGYCKNNLPVPAMWKFSESNKYRREIDVTVLL